MLLTDKTLVKYMMEKGFISTKSFVDGDLLLKDRSRRNLNYQVISEEQSYLVKQGLDKERIAAIANEAMVYDFLHRKFGAKERIKGMIPRFYKYDPKQNILVIELVKDGKNLQEYYLRIGRFSRKHAEIIGMILGTLHNLTELKDNNKYKHILKSQTQPRFIANLRNPNIQTFQYSSSASIQLIKIIQQNKELFSYLDEFINMWTQKCLIHSDVKLENFVISSGNSYMKKNKTIKLVDWELASLGDPAWDVGSVFSSYLALWLFSIPISDETSPDKFMEQAKFPIEKIQPLIQSFWSMYVYHMKLDHAASQKLLVRAAKYTSARLIQTGYEFSQSKVDLTGHVVCLIQLSINILKRPKETISGLFGIKENFST
ncbi:MAG: phosphotransferase [Nitrososphaeraceae archaeon]